MSYRSIILLVVATLNLLYQQGWLGKIAVPLSPAVTSVTYVYEKDENAIPNGVQAAIDKLNRERKIIASIFEDDVTDGSGNVPDQFKVAYEAAKQAGLPSLVVVAGDKAVRTVKAPKTDADVLEAVP